MAICRLVDYDANTNKFFIIVGREEQQQQRQQSEAFGQLSS
jgi:hypothetical protein